MAAINTEAITCESIAVGTGQLQQPSVCSLKGPLSFSLNEAEQLAGLLVTTLGRQHPSVPRPGWVAGTHGKP